MLSISGFVRCHHHDVYGNIHVCALCGHNEFDFNLESGCANNDTGNEDECPLSYDYYHIIVDSDRSLQSGHILYIAVIEFLLTSGDAFEPLYNYSRQISYNQDYLYTQSVDVQHNGLRAPPLYC